MRLFIFLLIQLTGMHMYAQEQQCSLTIEGQVIDLATNEHLEFANVFVEDLNTGVVTDHSGHFSLTNLCPGGVHLRISHIGFLCFCGFCGQLQVQFLVYGDHRNS